MGLSLPLEIILLRGCLIDLFAEYVNCGSLVFPAVLSPTSILSMDSFLYDNEEKARLPLSVY